MHRRGFLMAGVSGTLGSVGAWSQTAEADTVLRETVRAYQEAQALSADLTLTRKLAGVETVLRGTVRLQRPNRVRVALAGPPARAYASDGRTAWAWLGDGNRYERREVRPHFPETFRLLWAKPVTLFFDPENLVLNPLRGAGKVRTRLLGTETRGGVPFRVVEAVADSLSAERARLFIGPEGLVHRTETRLESFGETVELSAALTGLQVGTPMTLEIFAYTPPEGAVSDDPATRGRPGSRAPDFTASTATGGKVSLSGLLQQHAVVLLNFWFFR